MPKPKIQDNKGINEDKEKKENKHNKEMKEIKNNGWRLGTRQGSNGLSN